MGLSDYMLFRAKFIEAGRPLKEKKVYTIPKKSAKRIEKEKEQQTVIVKPKKAGWFDVNGALSKEAMDEIANGTGILSPTALDFSSQPKPKGSAELQRWFEDRHKELKGFCSHCGGVTQKGKENYKSSIHHFLPKSLFKSVATHPLNFLELCFYQNSCHTNLESHIIDLIELNCWDEVVTKFVKIYPSIAKEERRRIPKILLEYIETEI